MPVRFPQTIIAGPFEGTIAELAAEQKWRRIAVITGSSFEAATRFSSRLATAVDGKVQRWARGQPHAEIADVELIVRSLRPFEPDVIVSAGGGSSHDVAKGIATLLAYGGSLLDYCLTFQPPADLRFHPLPGSKVPIVTVPSTLSGSEGNGAAGFIPADHSGKRVIADPSLVPRAVVVDASLMAATPRAILLGSAMNALNHCVEGLGSRFRQPVSTFLLRSSLGEIVRSTDAYAKTGDPEALERAGVASAVTGAGMSGTWLGVAHALGHILGARYRVPHGWCHAVLAGAAVRWNADVAGKAHEEAASVLGIAGGSESLASWLDAKAAEWELPRTLRELGVVESQVPEIAAAAWHDHDTYFNPRRPADAAELEALLRAAL